MSNIAERKEKNCLNCNATVHGRYCHVCGQENTEPREKFGHMLTHFVFDLFHFDGKFFRTMKYLLVKPGFMAQEHLRGRRMDYLHPIRLYIFTSAFFFLFFFMVSPGKVDVNIGKKLSDTASIAQSDSASAEILKLDENFSSVKEYDSIQQRLPREKQDGYIVRKLQQQNLILKDKYPSRKEMMNKVFDVFTHQFPKMLFVSLPLFSFLLFLLYARKKNYYYVDHVVFTLHFYSTVFILIFLAICLNMLLDWTGFYEIHGKEGKNYLKGAIGSGYLSLLVGFYWYRSLRNFYGQSRRKTIVKFGLQLFINLFLFSLLFLLFFLFSFMII
ncbi:DUF3667 domain-containing protein [Sediminibacterium sp.]|uniref:DUF3667 domain-containing protein n=1 Tax=Sediminibacterium sp. TaxID=1917865 RepID=UPI003F6A1DF2